MTEEKMYEEEQDIDKRYEEEKKRLEDDLEAWEWCYERFKSKIDKIVEYERRVERLEAELEDGERVTKLRLSEEKNKLILLMLFFVMTSVILVKVTSDRENTWAFFVAGLAVGAGWTVIFNMLITKLKHAGANSEIKQEDK